MLHAHTLASTAIVKSDISPTDFIKITTLHLVLSKHAQTSPSAAPTSPVSLVSIQDVRKTPAASVSEKLARSQLSLTMKSSVQPFPVFVSIVTTPNSAVLATISLTAKATGPTGVIIPTIRGSTHVGIGLISNDTSIDDIVAAQTKWCMRRANLPASNFSKFLMDSGL